MTVTPTILPTTPARADAASVPGVVRVVRPDGAATRPLILASPHSGRDYRPELCAATRVPVEQLRRSEDAYVDQLIEGAAGSGASLVCALFPRVFIDANRARGELDPAMFRDRAGLQVDPASRRVACGLGVIPRVGADGQALYRGRLQSQEASSRLSTYYAPYHAALAQLIAETREAFGFAVVMDMHSMPEHSAPGVDFVLGDRFGQSCDPRVTMAIEAGLRGQGYVAVRNTPYAGGYTTEHYGKPATGVHVIQIEINRGLYLHESRVTPTAGFEMFREKIQRFIYETAHHDWACLSPS
ncbi:N-formylglutamate amidohydrolase [Maricaulis sp.]|uniref:N-formylglutamate amidohydrolase n=1 Tax=Maricaulis sp. TaxID=1486257 RepID=UPI003A9173B1